MKYLVYPTGKPFISAPRCPTMVLGSLMLALAVDSGVLENSYFLETLAVYTPRCRWN